jgi:Na+-driven multidrug efflux pump
MVLEMLMESIFALVDNAFISGLSVNAIATRGLTESGITLIYAFAIGLSMAITLKFGAVGVFVAITIAEILLAVASYILFKKGTWKELGVWAIFVTLWPLITINLNS